MTTGRTSPPGELRPATSPPRRASPSCTDGEAGEAADDDVLAHRARQRRAQLLDRLLVLEMADVDLVEQDALLHPGLELALGDLGADVLGLVGRLLLEDLQLGLLVGLGDLVLGHVLRVRRGGNVQRDVARERDEVVVAGDEVGVAVDLDQHADLAVAVDVRRDRALGGLALADLQRLVAEADAQQLDGGVEVAAGLGQRVLAVHHAGTGGLPELGDLLGGDGGGAHFASSSVLVSVVSGASAGASAAGSAGASAGWSAGASAAGSAGASATGSAGASAAGCAGASAAASSLALRARWRGL